MSQISLTASMRSNLLSLQSTASLMSQTQERLASGNKVNSAIDNPSSYYTAQSLNNRANDLNNLLDSMGQAISTIKAANEGIEAITTFVEQARAVANSALDNSDASTRAKYQTQFNEILAQINSLAADSGYKGVNLLGGSSVSLTVVFNEKTSDQSSLTIAGKDASTASTGLDIADATAWATATRTTEKTTALATAQEQYDAAKLALENNTDDDQVETLTAALTAKTTALNTAKSQLAEAQVADAADQATAIKASISAAAGAITKLRDMASEFGNNYSIVKTREDFTTNLINVLQEGADKLTLADMNEESANMLALQTRQQLAINSLSLASQASQSVLKLF